MRAGSGPAGWAASLGALALYLAFSLLVFSSAWADPGGRWIGEAKDPRLFIWYLGYLPGHVARLPPPLLTFHLNAPQGVNLMWNTSVIAPALLLWPVTASFGPVVGYNALVTAGLAASAWAGFQAAGLFIRRLALRLLAGALYGFSPALLAQATRHAHVVVEVLPPLALLLGYEAALRQRRSPLLIGAFSGLLALLQLLTSEEMLALTGVAALLGAALALLFRPSQVRSRLAHLGLVCAAAVAVFAVLAAYPLAVQFFGPQRAAGQLQPPDVYVNDLLAFVVPDLPPISFTGNPSEDNAYLGLPLLVVFAIACWAGRRDPLIRWGGWLAVLLALLSLGPHLHIGGYTTAIPLPWLLFQHLPLFESADADRLMLIGFLPVGLVVLRWVDLRWLAWTGRRQLLAAVALALALGVVFPGIPFVSTRAEAPAFFRAGGAVGRLPAGAVLLVTPFASKESSDAMYWQAVAGYRFRMPEGDAFTPGPTLGPKPSFLRSTLEALDAGASLAPSPGDRSRLLAELRELGVTAVVAGPSPGQVQIVDYLASVLERPPEALQGVDVWWDCCAATATKSSVATG